MKNVQKEKPKCTHCGKFYHTVDNCYQLVGYPDGRKRGGDVRGKQKITGKSAHFAAGEESPIPGLSAKNYAALVQYINANEEQRSDVPTANMAGKTMRGTTWVIDSGASEHITCDGAILQHQKRSGTEVPVRIPNGDVIPVKSIGSTELPNGVKINHVLNIPDFKCNLLSVSKLTKDLNCVLIFFPDFCVMQDLASRTLIGTGKRRDGLYFMELVTREGVALATTVDQRVWHRRLGHTPDV